VRCGHMPSKTEESERCERKTWRKYTHNSSSTFVFWIQGEYVFQYLLNKYNKSPSYVSYIFHSFYAHVTFFLYNVCVSILLKEKRHKKAISSLTMPRCAQSFSLCRLDSLFFYRNSTKKYKGFWLKLFPWHFTFHIEKASLSDVVMKIFNDAITEDMTMKRNAMLTFITQHLISYSLHFIITIQKRWSITETWESLLLHFNELKYLSFFCYLLLLLFEWWLRGFSFFYWFARNSNIIIYRCHWSMW
jgi:hypothetical protein